MLKTGNKAPEFILPDESGDDVSLSDLLAHGPLVLYFYPADFTPGCTKEACSFRDLHDELRSVSLTVAGVSPQDADTHRRFRDKYELPFRLLCDTDKTVSKMYDVNGPMGVGVRRATYLIAQDRTIQDAVLADVRIGKHSEFVKKAIKLRETAGLKRQTA